MSARPNRIKPLCRCGQPKVVSKSGRRGDYCAACRDARTKAWVEAHPERRRAIANAHAARAYAKDPEKFRAKTIAYGASHPETVRAAGRRYYHRKVAYVISKRATTRARRMGLHLGLTHAEWLARLEEFGGACAYCLRTDRPICRDHVIALSRGGTHTLDNVVPSCRPCNSKKSDRPVFVMAGG